MVFGQNILSVRNADRICFTTEIWSVYSMQEGWKRSVSFDHTANLFYFISIALQY